VHYEASDYAHKPFKQVLEDIEKSNARRRELNKPEVVYVAQCCVCPDKPKFTSLEEAQKHDKENINLHRRINGAVQNAYKIFEACAC